MESDADAGDFPTASALRPQVFPWSQRRCARSRRALASKTSWNARLTPPPPSMQGRHSHREVRTARSRALVKLVELLDLSRALAASERGCGSPPPLSS